MAGSAVSSAAPGAEAPPQPPDAAPIEDVGAASCEIRADELRRPRSIAAYASAEDAALSRPFARVTWEAAQFRVGAGELALATLSGLGLDATVLVRVADVPIGLSPTRRLGGGLIAPRWGGLELVGADANGVRVRLAHHQLIDDAALPIEERVPCSDLAPGPTPSAPQGSYVRLLRPDGLELRPSPSDADHGGFVLRAPRGADLAAWELARKDGFAQILVQASDGDLVGWVPTRSLRADRNPFGPPSEEAPPEARAPAGRRCAAAIRVASLTPRGPIWIGELRAGASLGVAKADAPAAPAGWSRVAPRGLEPGGAGSAGFAVRVADLERARCEEPSTPP